MTSIETTARPRARRRWPGIVAAVVLLGSLAVAAVAIWYLFLRPAPPAAVGLSSAPPAVAPGGSLPSGVASAAPARGLDGTWKVDPSIGSFSDFTGSFVGYRVEEELANIGAKTAVGRTPDVEGSLTLSGTKVTAASITADLTTLTSDSDLRDRQLGRQGLETGQFPTGTFTLTSPIELGTVPAEGERIRATAKGDLTLHGQTRAVEIPIETRLSGNVVTVTGSLPVVFEDYGMTAPRAMLVLSIADEGTMELQLQFTKA